MRRSAGSRGASVLFADASYFIALADDRDRWHRDAMRLKVEIPDEFVVTDFMIAEATTLIGARKGGRPARILFEYFLDACDIEYADDRTLREAMVNHLRFDGRMSVSDCVTLVVMERRRIRELVSFDSDFDRVKGIRRRH